MAKIIVEGSPKVLESFCSWFSNQGEQDFMEAWQCDGWNSETMSYDPVTSFITVKGYGINEPIQLVEIDRETEEEIPYD